MSIIQPDFSEVKELTPGEYSVRVTGAEVKQGKTSGTPYIRWTLETFGSDDDRRNGQKIWHNTMLAGAGAGMFKTFAKACGFDPSEQLDTDNFLGRELNVIVTMSEQGFAEVKSVKARLNVA